MPLHIPWRDFRLVLPRLDQSFTHESPHSLSGDLRQDLVGDETINVTRATNTNKHPESDSSSSDTSTVDFAYGLLNVNSLPTATLFPAVNGEGSRGIYAKWLADNQHRTLDEVPHIKDPSRS
jgi:hypothetical protein